MLVPMGVVLFKYPEHTVRELSIEVFVCNRVVLSRKKRIRSTLPKTNIKPEKSGKSETTFFLGLAYFQVLCYVRFFFGSVYREKNASLLS